MSRSRPASPDGLDSAVLLSNDRFNPMNVILISRDSDDLYRLCRDILNEFTGLDWRLTKETPENCPPDADLYIWDSPTKIDLPSEIEQSFSKHLFLLHRKDVEQLRQNLGSAEAAIVLKPVTRACLSAFLGLAASTFQGRISTSRSLRADRDEILQCLIQSNLQLQEYDQDRTNFLARAVHDFRAPLTAISGYCGLLLSEPMGQLNEDQREVLARMQHSAKRLNRMAAAMFQLSVERHLPRQPELVNGDIRDCVQQSVHEVAPFADKKHISISFDLDHEPPALAFEPGQMEQVMTNLLDNACKFTPRGGSIEIRAYPFFWERRKSPQNGLDRIFERERREQTFREPNAYRIDIVDSGAPIPQEHLEGIFEEYTSYSGGNDRSGGGLGLAICRLILHQHDGRVWADNTSTGPMFSFVLPLKTTEPAPHGVERSNRTEA